MVAVHAHRLKTILDRFVLANAPSILEFSVLTAFHTLYRSCISHSCIFHFRIFSAPVVYCNANGKCAIRLSRVDASAGNSLSRVTPQ